MSRNSSVSLGSCLSCLLALCVGASPLACKREADTAETSTAVKATFEAPTCDQAALAELAARLDAAEGDARVAIVAEGLLEACSDGLSRTTSYYLRASLASAEERRALELPSPDDPVMQASRTRLCADDLGAIDARLGEAAGSIYGSIIYEACDLKRYDLMSAEEAAAFEGAGWLTWTTHELLLLAETPAAVAKSISRAMMLFERAELGPTLIQLLPGQRLVELPAASPIPAGSPIYASATELVFNEQQLAALSEGRLPAEAVREHLVVRLFDGLEEEFEKNQAIAEQRGEDPNPRALLVFDARLPFATVVDIMYTSGRAGFSEYAMLVQTQFPVKKAVYIDPPKFGFGQPVTPKLKVFISDEGLHVMEPGAEQPRVLAKRAEGEGAAAYDLEALAKTAAALKSELDTAVLSAENTITFDVLLATYAALMGPDCNQAAPDTCVIPKLIIEAGAG